jgi:formamidopyrimidine-DNA glycosylase
VHYIRQHLGGKRIAQVKAQDDDKIFGKVGTSAAEFEKAMQDKTIVGAGQQGKYFWYDGSAVLYSTTSTSAK